MTEAKDEPLSPTVTKVLDAYIEALKGDIDIDDVAAGRLVDLLRQGKVPKLAEMDIALLPSEGDEAAS